MADTWHKGNAAIDGADRRGWLVGHFMDQGDIRSTEDVEIKWGIHPAGDERAEWMTDEYRTTIIFLVRGRFRIDLPGKSILLENEGDYAMWSAGTDHTWKAEDESVIVSVRWPSIELGSARSR